MLTDEKSTLSFDSKMTDIRSLNPTATIVSSPEVLGPEVGMRLSGRVPSEDAFRLVLAIDPS